MSGREIGSNPVRPVSVRRDLLIATALVLLGVLARVPYLAVNPVFEDEVLQTVYALNIRPGEFMPLVGDDPYTGPAFVYILAACLRLFGATAIAPRIVVMVMGALTVGLTYGLARAFGLGRPWAALVGLLMAANPHHILINSHYAGASYALPFFSTAFLLALALAVKRESSAWLIASGALLGLAMQANPILALALPGVIVWFLTQRKSHIGLRTRWPYLALVAFLLAYAPVIIYNLQNGLPAVSEASAGRSYLWQPNPSPQAFVENFWRLTLQLCRQVSGVLEGDETLRSLLGVPLVLSLWACGGLILAARRGTSLPLLAIGSQMLIMPWLSNHYGLTGTTRFTNQLTPLMLVAMGIAAERVWTLVQPPRPAPLPARERGTPSLSSAGSGVLIALFFALSLWPLTQLFAYYDHAIAQGETNAPAFAFFDGFKQQWKGETVLLNDSPTGGKTAKYFLTVNRVPYDPMPLGRIMEKLATGQTTGSVTLILYDDDLPRIGGQADLRAWDIRAKTGYGAYTIADARQVRKPSFVFASPSAAPSVRAVQANLADQITIIGYQVRSEKVGPGSELVVNVHWQAAATMPEAYIGFLHLVGPGGQFVAQDDHELGRGFYRTIFWQPGEVIREKYTLTVPKNTPPGDYVLRAGAYHFPSLQRLAVRSANAPTQDDIVTLGAVRVEP